MNKKQLLNLHDDVSFCLDEINVVYKRLRDALWLIDQQLIKIENKQKKEK